MCMITGLAYCPHGVKFLIFFRTNTFLSCATLKSDGWKVQTTDVLIISRHKLFSFCTHILYFFMYVHYLLIIMKLVKLRLHFEMNWICIMDNKGFSDDIEPKSYRGIFLPILKHDCFRIQNFMCCYYPFTKPFAFQKENFCFPRILFLETTYQPQKQRLWRASNTQYTVLS